MDNIKINISDEKIYIKKGFMKKKYLYIWYFIIVIIILTFLFLNGKEDTSIFKILEFFFNKYKLGIIINMIFIISFLGLGFLGFSLYLSLYLEKIEVSNIIEISTPNYKIILTSNNLEEIFITPYYIYKNFRYEKSTFREYFESKCTIVFKTKDNREYKWGHTLSYQKGIEIKKIIEDAKNKIELNKKMKNLMNKYNLPLNERYINLLNIIIDEKKIFLLKKEDYLIINGDSKAITNLEIFRNMNFEEINFYVFYVNYLSKKEYENKKILVGYNGVDGKEVTISKLKEDINEIRDSRSSFK